jgi:hypothetical protein
MLTIESLIDRIEPYLKRAIQSELPFGTRWLALQLARWKIRKVIEIQVALHGHQVGPVLDAARPISDRLFKPEVAQALRDVKAICDLPISEFGDAAIAARNDAGPPVDVVR